MKVHLKLLNNLSDWIGLNVFLKTKIFKKGRWKRLSEKALSHQVYKIVEATTSIPNILETELSILSWDPNVLNHKNLFQSLWLILISKLHNNIYVNYKRLANYLGRQITLKINDNMATVFWN